MTKLIVTLAALTMFSATLFACAFPGGGVNSLHQTNLGGAPGTPNDTATGGQGDRGTAPDQL